MWRRRPGERRRRRPCWWSEGLLLRRLLGLGGLLGLLGGLGLTAMVSQDLWEHRNEKRVLLPLLLQQGPHSAGSITTTGLKSDQNAEAPQ